MAWLRFWRRGASPDRSTPSGAVGSVRRGMRGRQFLAGVPYMLPKDDAEISRLDFQHFMLRYVFRGNIMAPINSPTSILDVGCGTGRWAMEVAAQFPSANVVGVDIVPVEAIQTLGNGLDRKPDNYAFVAGNILEGLPFADGVFDYVHQRLLYAAIPADRWPGVIQELVRVTRSGGWVELVEGDIVHGGGPGIDAVQRWILDGAGRRNINLQISPQLGTLLERSGLQRVAAQAVPLQMGRKGGRLGAMVEADIFSVFDGYGPRLVTAGIMGEEEYAAALRAARAEVARGHCTVPFHLIVGQRP